MAGPSQAPPPAHPALRALVHPLDLVHPLRVAAHSSLRTLVAFALAHLAAPHPSPLLLHTLPPPDAPAGAATAALLPKLVSLAQLITRLATVPLHSYTRLDALEHLNLAPAPPPAASAAADDRDQMLHDLVALEWLTGRAGTNRRPRRRHTPCMVILLSPAPVEHLPAAFTHQPPVASPSATKRSKRSAPPTSAPAPPSKATGAPPRPKTTETRAPRPDGGNADAARSGTNNQGVAADQNVVVAEGEAEAPRKRRRTRRKGRGKGRGQTAKEVDGPTTAGTEGPENRTSAMDVEGLESGEAPLR